VPSRFSNPPHHDYKGFELEPTPDDGQLGLHVGHVPGRKSKVLYLMDGSVMWGLAYFRSDIEADRFIAAMTEMLTRTHALAPAEQDCQT
jgi:hypothetical protein